MLYPHLLVVKKSLTFLDIKDLVQKRPITHLVGKSIIKGDYEEALEYLLNFFTSKYDSEKDNGMRKLISERKSETEVIELLPYSMDIERNLLANNSRRMMILKMQYVQFHYN